MYEYNENKNYQTTYRKRNGEIVIRYTRWNDQYQIGETNSFGWIIVDVKEKFWGDNKFYTHIDYQKKVKEWKLKQKKPFRRYFILLCRKIHSFTFNLEKKLEKM